jgi:hypothetical protein
MAAISCNQRNCGPGRKALRLCLIFVLAPLCLAYALHSLENFGTEDSIAYWGGVHAFLDGKNPYDPDTLLRIQRTASPNREVAQFFLNPPWTIPLLIPIFCWDFATSSLALLSINIFLTFFAMWRLGNLFTPLPPLYLVFVCGFLPVVACWRFGQLSCFLLVGILLSLEWVVQNYRPWWKIAVAFILLSIKPQTPYLLVVTLLVAVFRHCSKADLLKIALVALLPLSFLVSQSNLVGWWLSSFDKVLNWRTSTLPSLRYKHQSLHRNDGLT